MAADSAASICDQVILADLNGSTWTEQLAERFDVVLMGDVLEHLLYPDEVLRRVRKLLLPGGVIVVSLSQCCSLVATAKNPIREVRLSIHWPPGPHAPSLFHAT